MILVIFLCFLVVLAFAVAFAVEVACPFLISVAAVTFFVDSAYQPLINIVVVVVVVVAAAVAAVVVVQAPIPVLAGILVVVSEYQPLRDTVVHGLRFFHLVLLYLQLLLQI